MCGIPTFSDLTTSEDAIKRSKVDSMKNMFTRSLRKI